MTPAPLDIAWQRINALGGYVAPSDAPGRAANAAIGDALKVIEDLGGTDPLRKRTAPHSETRLLLISNALNRACEALRVGRIGNAKHILAEAQALMSRELEPIRTETKRAS